MLYNNLKGRIIDIQKGSNSITFTIDAETILTARDCQREQLELIQVTDTTTRVRFSVFAYDDKAIEENEDLQKMTVVPFQLGYAVSIHKAQGLEYDSVKVVIPHNNAERITHDIFYTAITRAKKQLKIYWSSETMKEIVSSFEEERTSNRSLEVIKAKLNLQ